jgi:hypothetical protein
MNTKRKATNEKLTPAFLAQRVKEAEAKGWGKAKWIMFCERMMAEGFDVTLYEARRTFSKYVTVRSGAKSYKVRFSNHRPIKRREEAGDCDFFVGVCNLTTTTTDQAITATLEAMKVPA